MRTDSRHDETYRRSFYKVAQITRNNFPPDIRGYHCSTKIFAICRVSEKLANRWLFCSIISLYFHFMTWHDFTWLGNPEWVNTCERCPAPVHYWLCVAGRDNGRHERLLHWRAFGSGCLGAWTTAHRSDYSVWAAIWEEAMSLKSNKSGVLWLLRHSLHSGYSLADRG
jgi:hypothetical protein